MCAPQGYLSQVLDLAEADSTSVQALLSVLDDDAAAQLCLRAEGPGSARLQASYLLLWVLEELEALPEHGTVDFDRIPVWREAANGTERNLNTILMKLSRKMFVEVR